MGNLYGVGCQRCNAEIAAALRDMPRMDGYLDTDSYVHRYKDQWSDRPLTRVDGVYMPYTTAMVAGEDGWLLALHMREDRPHQCECGSGNVSYELWRGTVEIR